jgi:serine/threonine protein kinase
VVARKTIQYARRLNTKAAISEIEKLQRIRHQHIRRVVGSYTFKNTLSILLYPVAQYHLETFMDSTFNEMREPVRQSDNGKFRKASSLCTFFFCLAHAVDFLHQSLIMHGAIKARNVLIRTVNYSDFNHNGPWKVYLSEFGISPCLVETEDTIASSVFPHEAEIKRPKSCSPPDAAAEAKLQNSPANRGFRADMLSLGCVFAEMLAVLMSDTVTDERIFLHDLLASGQDSWNIDKAIHQLQALDSRYASKPYYSTSYLHSVFQMTLDMMCWNPRKRPTATIVAKSLKSFFTCESCCRQGSEPFELCLEELIGLT